MAGVWKAARPLTSHIGGKEAIAFENLPCKGAQWSELLEFLKKCSQHRINSEFLTFGDTERFDLRALYRRVTRISTIKGYLTPPTPSQCSLNPQRLLHQQLLPLLPPTAVPTRRTPPIPHTNNLILALLARRHLHHLTLTRLRPRLQHHALLPPPRQRTPRIRELKWRLALQAKHQFCRASLMDISDLLLTASDVRLRQCVDGLGDGHWGPAVASRIGDRGDGEVACAFGPARECGVVDDGFAVARRKRVVDCEWRGAGEAE